MKNRQHRPWNTPWFLSDTFFSIFFGLIVTAFIVTFVGQAVLVTLVTRSAVDSGGVIPAAEKILCGQPGCLKTYIQSTQEQ